MAAMLVSQWYFKGVAVVSRGISGGLMWSGTVTLPDGCLFRQRFAFLGVYCVLYRCVRRRCMILTAW